MSSFSSPSVAESALQWLRSTIEDLDAMPQRKTRKTTETCGQRLARLRKARGLTQTELGAQVGLSYRMVAYYESQTDRPPAHVLPELARALGVSVDELLGIRRGPAVPVVTNLRLWRRLQQIERLPPAARKAVLKVLDGYLARFEPEREAR